MKAIKYLALAALCWAAWHYGKAMGAHHEREERRRRELVRKPRGFEIAEYPLDENPAGLPWRKQ